MGGGAAVDEGWLQAFRSVVAWQLRGLNIGTPLFLVEEEDLALPARHVETQKPARGPAASQQSDINAS